MAVNSNYVLARNKKTGVEVEMPPKTFEILRKQYDLVSGEVQESTQKKTTVKGAELVAPEKKVLTPDEIAAKKTELQAMNQAAAEKVEQEKAKLPMNHPAVIAHRKKPGPKSKINA